MKKNVNPYFLSNEHRLYSPFLRDRIAQKYQREALYTINSKEILSHKAAEENIHGGRRDEMQRRHNTFDDIPHGGGCW